MGNKATQQPRSFNTIRRSQTKARAKRRTIQRVVLLAIFATVALILLSLLVLGGFAIANAIIDARPAPDNGDDTPTPPVTDLVFIQTTKSADAIHTGQLILVNSENEYKFPIGVSLPLISEKMIKKTDGSRIYSPVPGVEKLEEETLEALNAMMYRYYELDEDAYFTISSAYRTKADQEALGSSVQPGYSDHHTGYCVAIKYPDSNHFLETDHWFYQNCYKYGFVVRYPEEKASATGVSGYKHCFRYVGVSHATYMTQNNLCMEEYVELLQSNYNSSAKRLSINAADGFTYEVYYVAASGQDVTTLDVPSNYNYTVSGDNRSGFIVTVKMTAPAA